MPLRRTSSKTAIGFGAMAVLAYGLNGPAAMPSPLPTEDILASEPAAELAVMQSYTQVAYNPAQSPRTRGNQPVSRTLKVTEGDTLMDMLVGAGVSQSDAHEALGALSELYSPNKLKIGQAVTVSLKSHQNAQDGGLVGLKLQADVDKDISVERAGDGFKAKQFTKELTLKAARSSGVINSSLFDAATSAGMPLPVLFQMVKAFSFDVDFQRDIQPGDTFEVMFERFHDRSGKALRDGEMLYATLTLSGQRHRIFRHTTRDGQTDYYNENGESVRKALMRTPINGARLTSGFGMRHHPILGFSTMHKGVDFAASTGTPILAAGDGTIEMASVNGSYGKYVRIRHGDFKTAYAHMSAFGPSIREGKHVRQGEVIGFVGTTGRSTGPHLHFELLRHDVQVNPQSIKNVPTGRKLDGEDLRRFRNAKVDAEKRYAGLPEERKMAAKD